MDRLVSRGSGVRVWWAYRFVNCVGTLRVYFSAAESHLLFVYQS